MKNIVILGGGLVGRAVAYDLQSEHHVTVMDTDINRLRYLKNTMPSIHISRGDASSPKDLLPEIAHTDLVIGALPPSISAKSFHAVIEAGIDTVQISSFSEDVALLDEVARDKNVTAVIDAGIAPGLPNLILGYHITQMPVERYECLYGSLPAEYTPPLYHRDHYPIREVIDEYLTPARAIEHEQPVTRGCLSISQELELPGIGPVAAFPYDGLGSLLHTMRARVPFMSQHLLRHPEHIRYLNTLRESGLLSKNSITLENGTIVSPFDVTTGVLEKFMCQVESEPDYIAIRVTLQNTSETHSYDLLDRNDAATQMSAMSRCAGYTGAAVARLVLNGKFIQKGIYPTEYVGMEADCFHTIIADLSSRNIILKEHTIRDKHT